MTLGLGAGYAPLRVYNDVDVDLVNLFRCARDRPLALLRELDFLPLHARADFEVVLRFLSDRGIYVSSGSDAPRTHSRAWWWRTRTAAMWFGSTSGRVR